VTVNRVVWAALVPFCVWLALTAIVVIVRHNITNGDEAPGDVITMESLAYSPETLTIRPGTEVVFNNRDVAPHTVTADDGSFDTGLIQPGSAFRAEVSSGFTYFCAVHPAMTGEIRMGG
jgi:plastocyanin